MNTRFIFSLALTGLALCPPTKSSAQAEQDWDKPAWIEEIVYENWRHSIVTLDCGTYVPEEISLNYNTETGGSSTAKITENNCTFDRYGIRWKQWLSTWNGPYSFFNQGTLVYSQSNGQAGYTTAASSPSYIRERCDVIDTQHPNANTTDDWDRVAYTTLKLHTGGKSSDPRRRLFTFNVSATRVQNPRWRHFGGIGGQNGFSIAPSSITVYNGTLGSDGNRYIVLDDNRADVDITPYANYDYYTYNLSFSKHKLDIYANGTQLDRYAPNYEVCVGQKVTFSWQFSPPVSGLSSASPNWSVGGSFVNYSYTFANCMRYQFEPSYLTQNSHSLWWVRGGTESPTLNLGLGFSNGQSTGVADKGYISVHVPTLNLNLAGTPGGRHILPGYVGDSHEARLDNPVMSFSGNIQSRFNGTARITQLIRSDTTTDAPPWRWNTHGEYWADNGESYSEGSINAHQNGWPLPPFQDSPSMAYFTALSLDLGYKAYVRFKPDGDSIFVTLGRVDWSWSCGASSSTFSSFAPAPSYSSDSSFPVWNATLWNGVYYP